jgi:hypothetical protein
MLIAKTHDLAAGVCSVIDSIRTNLPQSCEGFENKAQTDFETELAKFVQKKNQPQVHEFVSYLCSESVANFVYTLRKAPTKKRPLSFDRLGFALLPLVQYFEQTTKESEMPKVEETLSKWINLVNKNPNIGINLKFDA